MNEQPGAKPPAGNSEARQAFYDRIGTLSMAPLWESFHDLITPEPVTPCVPALWNYREVRPHLLESGGLISAQEAERRVLILENPALPGRASITHSLYAGLQLVLPGEVAPAHRHSQSALRLVIEGSGAYTSVNGERTLMEKGDFIITPPWSWHEHGNDTGDPVVWLDGLDIPLVRFFDASFVERYEEDCFPETRPVGDNVARYGSNMLPVGYEAVPARSPMFSYPYVRSREALERMRRTEEWDPHHGLKMEFVNPLDGGPAMTTISTFLQLLPKGFAALPYRATDGTVYTAIEGSGETVIGEKTFAWSADDVFVVPAWAPHHHRAAEDAVLFSFSDRGVQRKLGLFREWKADSPA